MNIKAGVVILEVHAFEVGEYADGRHFHATIEILSPIDDTQLGPAIEASLLDRYKIPADADITPVIFGHRTGTTWFPGPDDNMYVINGVPASFTEPDRAEKARPQ